MAPPNPRILWPVVFDTASQNLTVFGNISNNNLTMTVTPGRYYWLSGDGQADTDGGVGGVGDLLLMLKDLLEDHAQIATATVTMTAARKINITTINGGPVVHLLDYDAAFSTLDPRIYGHPYPEENYPDPAASSSTSINEPMGVFSPGRPVREDSRALPGHIWASSTSLSGKRRTARFAARPDRRKLMFDLLTKEKALQEYAAATEPFGALDTWIDSALSLGMPFRYYPDESSLGTSDYQLLTLADGVGNSDELIRRSSQEFLRWSCALDCQVAV